ncbi:MULTISPECIES: long-chain fatty acid--CoA ligase [Micromonospora]|uniref:Acyl-CoA synthetase n=1 Tax=Micromonospora solifontis TaxID=2487138 RepID=A0ABX9WDT9_9ACTN|nr:MULTISPECIES: long-chain fatty acid--CoA ligase [Micromonospora]NES12329.1 long-chain fatty acid--CoA ligase [Micromonospora sp. PPF5-17B]NES37768.1 long-chain fatty acid--CoA ligase [Micromonospora solifontis]NES54188.1 long-chain fatty acid--CoA ligase [Micromonospora sp. PPF5-6]RNL97987.1 long-chain fatty acid--CoA ligase [Micromonospora solifontis]
MREFSVPPIVTVGDAANLTDPVWENAEVAPDTVQFVRRTGGPGAATDVTCRQFRDEVVAVARGLVAAGVSPGDRVALMSRTRYEWTLLDYAIWAAGAVTVPIYETSSAEQAAWILADSGAVSAVVESTAHATLVAGVRDRLPELREVWQIELGAVDQLVAAGESVDPAEVEVRRSTLTADDIATIIYTSGTTGRPKGCVLTHRNIYADIANAVPVLPNLFRQGASTLLFLPLAHAFARLIQVGVVQARATMAHCSDTKNLVAELQDFKPTFVLSVPRVFEKVYNGARQKAESEGKGKIFDRAEKVAIAYSEALETADGPGLALRAQHALFDKLVYRKLRAAMGGRCRDAISGGAPLGARLGHFFRGVGVTICEGYGLTETSPAAAANLPGHTRVGTVGRPLPGVTIRIADDGEILISGDIVFRGYWHNEPATAEALTSDGWFRTGDLGRLDEDGYLSITGRKKEIIVTAGGKNVAPAVLEDQVRAHPLVSQCLVVGDRQPFIAALVTIDEEALPGWLAANGRPADTTVADLRADEALLAEVQGAVDQANQSVSKAEAIKVFRILPQDFTEATGELTPSLKVKRQVVHKTYAAEIADIYRG